jgi:hypothetical protein
MKWQLRACCAALCILSAACTGVQQRGMAGSVYVSSSRPAIALGVKNMPLVAAGEGMARLVSSGMMGGLPIRMWLAVYGGANERGAMAITAHAEVPRGWYWDSDMRRPFSVNAGVEVFNDMEYQACTYIVDESRDPFGALAEGTAEIAFSGSRKWMARGFAARYNFNDDKIILEYREPLPEGIVSLSALPMGLGDAVMAFEQRAREAFLAGPPPAKGTPVLRSYAQNIQWRYMDERFLGTVSRYETFDSR